MATAGPLVSVIITSYNAGEFLRPALDSALAQTHRNLEVVLVDDGSTDGSVDALMPITDPRVRLLRQENRGRPAALNVALDAMRGEFFVLQDADDLSHPCRVERQLDVLMKRPELAAVFCGYELILDGERCAPRFGALDVEQSRRMVERWFSMPGHDPTAMWRTAHVRDMRHDPKLPIAHGVDYVLRAGEKLPMAVLGECLYSYRVHTASISRKDPRRRMADVDEVYRRARERRGLTPPPPASPTRRITNRDRDNGLAAHFIDSVLDLRGAGRWRESLATAMRCARMHPLDLWYLKPLVYATMPLTMVRKVRAWKGR